MTKAISLNDTDSMLQLCAQLNPGCAGSDNSDSEWIRCIFCMRSHVTCEKLLLKLFSLSTAIQELTMILNTYSAEIIALTTNSQYKCIVRYLPSIPVAGCQQHYFSLTIHTYHAAKLKRKMVPLCLRKIIQLINTGIQRTSCNFVKERLPDVR
ncbi:hypothetical protein BIKONL_004082 [Pseudomonas putida]